MRKTIIFLSILLISTSVFAGTFYYNGKVTGISDTMLKVERNTYRIDGSCKVIIQYKEDGVFHEKPATLKELKVGDWVTVRTDGKSVTEILIEQYRQK